MWDKACLLFALKGERKIVCGSCPKSLSYSKFILESIASFIYSRKHTKYRAFPPFISAHIDSRDKNEIGTEEPKPKVSWQVDYHRYTFSSFVLPSWNQFFFWEQAFFYLMTEKKIQMLFSVSDYPESCFEIWTLSPILLLTHLSSSSPPLKRSS